MIELKDIDVHFQSDEHVIKAVKGVSLKVDKGGHIRGGWLQRGR